MYRIASGSALVGEEPPDHTPHFTPTSGSWLDLAEVFFGIIIRRAVRRWFFDSVKQPVTAIHTFIEGRNDRCHPSTWTRTTGEIPAHAARRRDSDARHQVLCLVRLSTPGPPGPRQVSRATRARRRLGSATVFSGTVHPAPRGSACNREDCAAPWRS